MNREQLLKELSFSAARSSGPGGQHVNKTSSKITVQFHVDNSLALSEVEKTRINERLANRINTEGNLVLHCGETRSQHRNKALVIQRLINLIVENLRVRKPRKRSKPSRRAIEKRLDSKKRHALKKSRRKPPNID
ncbi:aminoacyl-tRNA hydrolase [Aureitalea sp. L0-47]|uniref:alternative ribosome rescue aminoacyl-tRNA hydrolase ArfB n=1 Tax=Aureitalea sp. L0-47 TaxID=2816962 RepID=UPI0022386347|nr:alternative ribosome rescue aminoacyl-tRNA hydrolase ArfB [Aureitalea sp. L0-47]MCW5518408.1 aminoacyl-tRNA hydrolase [Aureitalea sp. L0-47]